MNSSILKYQYLVMLLIFICVSSLVEAKELTLQGANDQKESTATLPLAEILRLYEQKSLLKQTPIDLPPMDASINEINIHSQLLEKAMQIKASFEVVVLSDNKWVSIPLFVKDSDAHIYQLPKMSRGHIVEDKNNISLITNKAGKYRFEIALLQQASIEQQLRKVTLKFSSAAKAVMNINYDEDLFQLIDAAETRVNTETSAGAVAYPSQGIFQIHWRQLHQSRLQTKTAARPPLEAMVKQAQLSTIVTLEGELITRALYQLHFEGSKQLSFSVPQSYSLKKVYLNGSAIAFKVKNSKVTLEVLPSRAGDRQGSLELTLIRKQGKFHLSGDILFAAPQISWPIREMFMEVFLPDVFNYQYTGGSMSTSKHQQRTKYTYDLPTPGKQLGFHQLLITSAAPSVKVKYAIDLNGKYFDGH